MKTPKNSKSKQSIKRPHKFKEWLEILLAIAAIILIPLFFATRSQAGQPVQTDTLPALGTTIPSTSTFQAGLTPINQPTPTALPNLAAAVVANGQEPPACSFPLAQIKTSPSAPQNYTFSEPQVVLTAPKGNRYNIAQWLPDDQQVLMTEELRSSVPYGQVAPESIELYNPETGKTKVVATRPISNELPAWLPQLNAVIYPAAIYQGKDQKTNASIFSHQVWISYGDPAGAQKLADNLPQLPMAVKPDGSQTLYFSEKQLSKRNGSMQAISSAPSFDSTQWDYGGKGPRDNTPVSYEMAWQPGTSLIFLYSDAALDKGGYTFILNADTGRVCELNFGGWASSVAHWSSDGRYLAIIRFPTLDLIVLDTITGKLTTLNIIPQEMTGAHYVLDFVWAPDNQHLLAIGDIDLGRGTQEKINLYLVDLLSGQSVNIFPAYWLYTNTPPSMAWSPDGSKLVIRCPTDIVDQICFIQVHKKQ